MDPKTFVRISIASSAGAFLFSVLITTPLLALLFGSISIAAGVLAIRDGVKAAYVSIGLSVLWMIYAAIFVLIRGRELGVIA